MVDAGAERFHDTETDRAQNWQPIMLENRTDSKAGGAHERNPRIRWPRSRAISAARTPTTAETIRTSLWLGSIPGLAGRNDEELAPLPQRSSLRSGLYCPSPSTLIRPHPSHSQAHPDFTALRFIRDAFAVLVRLGDPRLVPCFRCSFLIDMPPSTTPGSPSAAFAQFFANGTSLRHDISDSALPFTPSSVSDGK